MALPLPPKTFSWFPFHKVSVILCGLALDKTLLVLSSKSLLPLSFTSVL